MTTWLQFHIFTGLVGPYMILLHSSWKFNGLAGMVMLFTIIVVASGFLGRYIYTAVARNADGIEIQANDLEDQIRVIDGELQNRLATQPDLYRSMMGRFAPAPTFQGAGLIFGRAFDEWKSRLNWWWISSRMDRPARAQAKKIHVLLKKERNLRRQVISMAMTRRLLGLWHAIHIPVGMALFTAALIHIIAAIYYSTMLH